MLTKEENELLTRVGPGTPCGELLRRYWWPIGLLPDVSAQTPTKYVRVLGEDLVLFRDTSGNIGLLGDHCAHRGASLLYGRVEERGIACAYHGWLYDTAGNCLETPAEPAASGFHLTVKQKAYPVQEYCGLYWAYLGPSPAPLLPRIDIADMGVVVGVGDGPQLSCSWLQFVENNLDQAHVYILHQDTARIGPVPTNTTRGLIDMLVSLQYTEDPYGIVRRMELDTGYVELDLLVFPAAQRLLNHVSVKVPVDDTRCRNYRFFVDPARPPAFHGEPGGSNGGFDYFEESVAEGKDRTDATHPLAKYRADTVRFQDIMVLESQGSISPRENEHLATSDRGVALLRRMLFREIEKVQQGLDPIGVFRDPDACTIDTHTETVMPDRHRWLTPNGVRIHVDRGLVPVGLEES